MIINPQYMPKATCVPKNLGALFLPYQERWIRDKSQKKAMEKGRQIGLSWSTAYRLTREASLKTARYDFWVSSRDDIQAKLFLEDCKAFAKILQTAAKDLGDRIYEDENGKPFTAYVLEFANGKRIHSMSSNPDAQAGKRGSRVLDEFALHPDPRKLYAIAYPGITWGGQIEIISTHRGSHNFFNRTIIEDAKGRNKLGFSLHTVTLQDALDQGFLYKLQTKLAEGGAEDPRLDMDEADYFNFVRSGCADDETFQQEYMCVPADDASTFLSYELIDRCTYDHGVDWEIPLRTIKNPLYVGVDVGRDHDLTVIWVLEKQGDVDYTRKKIELHNQEFAAQEAVLYNILRNPYVRRCCIDASGLGRQFAERARKRFGTYRVEEVKFTAPVKEELAYPLKAAFEDRTLRIPRDDSGVLVADLRAIKKETTAAGNIRFAADRGKNGHADRFWALALAKHAAKSVHQPLPAPPRKQSERQIARRRRCVE